MQRESVQELIDAAVRLLQARANDMITRVEWDDLVRAVERCGVKLDKDVAEYVAPTTEYVAPTTDDAAQETQ